MAKIEGGVGFLVKQGTMDRKSLKALTEAIREIAECKCCEGDPAAEAQVKVQALKALSKMQKAQPVNIHAGTVSV